MRVDWWRWRSERRARDLDDEIAHDLEREAEDRLQSGASRPAAEAASRRDFGNVLLIKEAARDARASRRRAPIAAGVGDDARRAVRWCLRMPAFTASILAVLALGIAANVAVFSIANAVLLTPLALPDADRIVVLGVVSPGGASWTSSPAIYEHFRAQRGIIQDVAAFRSLLLSETSGAVPEPVRAHHVSGGYFRLFGASTIQGRTFTTGETRPGGSPVAVLSHRFWARRFGGANGVGQTVRLNGVSYTVVGVLDADFSVEDIGRPPDVWLPLSLAPDSQGHFFTICGRLRPGVTLAQARSALRESGDQFRRSFRHALSPTSAFTARPVEEVLVGETRPLLIVLLGAVAVVLLIACSNVANLPLLQGAGRGRELAVMMALGASRGRVVRQLLVESLLLSICSGAVGLVLGAIGARAFLAMVPSALPRVHDFSALQLDWRVAAFTVVAVCITEVLCGLVPALRISKVDLRSTASAAGYHDRRPARQRMEASLVVLQVALALVLLSGAVPFLRAVVAVTSVDPGFEMAGVLTLRTPLGGQVSSDTARVEALVRRGTEALERVSGVAAVGASYGLPLENRFILPLQISGRPLPADRPSHGAAAWWAVSPGYFSALRIPVERGRTFTPADDQSARPVVIINAVLAQAQWPDSDPIGQSLVIGRGVGPEFQHDPARQVVGVVGAVRDKQLDQEPVPSVYVPVAQLPDVFTAFVAEGAPLGWIVRTEPGSDDLRSRVPRVLQTATGVSAWNVRSLDEIAAGLVLRERLSLWLMTALGGAALVLAAIGLYGLVAHFVQQHAREIGIRLALGAEVRRVQHMVTRKGIRLVAAGAVIGLGCAFAFERPIARILQLTQDPERLTFLPVLVPVALAAGMALWLAVRRVSRVDPIVSLRQE